MIGVESVSRRYVGVSSYVLIAGCTRRTEHLNNFAADQPGRTIRGDKGDTGPGA